MEEDAWELRDHEELPWNLQRTKSVKTQSLGKQYHDTGTFLF